jgi:hypothetical protein
MEMAVESMVPGVGRVPEQRLLSPNLVCDDGGATKLFVGRGWYI